MDLRKNLSFGFEQTFTISNWWSDEGFTATSDTPLKREYMLKLAQNISKNLQGTLKESLDIWDHLQYETFDQDGNPSFIVTMDPGSIEVKTPPVLIHQVQKMAKILMHSAEESSLLPYRNWWYGIQGGTEGGCHVNFGGLSKDSNPLRDDPSLVVKYAAYIHNRPFLHYPFMGVDIGPGGNAMRMDEKENFKEVKSAFNNFDLNRDAQSVSKVYDYFKDTNLISNKSSFPSLYKFTEELSLIEDRAHEAMRTADDFLLIAELKLKILEHLQKEKSVEKLKNFDENLHLDALSSYSLWSDFQYWCNSLNINPVPYQVFFDRQFPRLWKGENPPQSFSLKEGRRVRVITDIKKRGDTIISKTIDPTYKRFEIEYYHESDQFEFIIEASGVEYQSQLMENQGYLGFGPKGKAFYKIFNIHYSKESPKLTVVLIDKNTNQEVEKKIFDINNMMWD